MRVHSSSRAGGRPTPPAPVDDDGDGTTEGDAEGKAEGVVEPDAPGLTDEADAAGPSFPSASIAAADPGAIVDSPTSKRLTANRTGALGSTGGRVPAGDPLGDESGDAAGLAAPPEVAGLAAPPEAAGLAATPGAAGLEADGAGPPPVTPSGGAAYTPSDCVPA